MSRAAPIPPTNVQKPSDCYRRTGLGISLQEVLDEMLQEGKLDAAIVKKILLQFDYQMSANLSRATPRLNFKVGEIEQFKQVGDMYEFLMTKVGLDIASVGGRDTVTADNVDAVSGQFF